MVQKGSLSSLELWVTTEAFFSKLRQVATAQNIVKSLKELATLNRLAILSTLAYEHFLQAIVYQNFPRMV